MPDTIPKKRNVAVTLPTSVPVYEGYAFEGWATSPEGATVYQTGDEYDENRSITLYAVWSHTHVYDQEVATSPYFCSPANCLNQTLYYKSCLCGESSEGKVGEKRFTYGELGNHIWNTTPGAQYKMDPLYYCDSNNNGEITPATPYLETEFFGDILEAWHSSYGEQPEGLDSMGFISPCIYCGGHKMKSGKLYEINKTSCTICHESNTGFVFAWECYDCGNTNTQQFPILHTTHDYGKWNVITPATCTTTGMRQRVCTYGGCDAFETETIPITTHKSDSTTLTSTSKPCNKCGETISGWKQVGVCTVCGVEFIAYSTYDDHTCSSGGGSGYGELEGDALKYGYCSTCNKLGHWDYKYHYMGDEYIDELPERGKPKHACRYFCPECGKQTNETILTCVTDGIPWTTWGGIQLGDTPCPKCDSVGTMSGTRYECQWCGEDRGGKAQCRAEDCLETFFFNKGESF